MLQPQEWWSWDQKPDSSIQSVFLAFFILMPEGQSCAFLPRESASYMCSNCNRAPLQGRDPTPFLCLGLLGSLVMPIDSSE